MKLDRNINPDGAGKYALVNMRRLRAVQAAVQTERSSFTAIAAAAAATSAMATLQDLGIISFGNETPGDQFFVMKYKDKFTGPGLQAYAEAVQIEAQYAAHSRGEKALTSSLMEYANQIHEEAILARRSGNRIPD